MAHDSESPPSTRRLRTVSIVVTVFALVVVAYGLVSRAAQNSHLHDLTEARAVPNVAVINPSSTSRLRCTRMPSEASASA